ncbi:transposable element Tcb2 transposase [Trichonephila clavipes]|nr:transposable element Tcb2 transposase [Trichonephila clavipes]
MDGNTRPHRVDIVVDYLESERMTRVAWPAYSPHLNPIEKRWDAHSRAVSSRFPPPATLIELETALQEEWRLFNSAAVDYLIEIMVRREIEFPTYFQSTPKRGQGFLIICRLDKVFKSNGKVKLEAVREKD